MRILELGLRRALCLELSIVCGIGWAATVLVFAARTGRHTVRTIGAFATVSTALADCPAGVISSTSLDVRSVALRLICDKGRPLDDVLRNLAQNFVGRNKNGIGLLHDMITKLTGY